jgi:RNA polymerase sigma-70 factor, ECF subfamily
MHADGMEDLERAYYRDGGELWKAIYAFSGGSHDVADEAVAEAFAQAARHVAPIGNLHAWLYRAAFRIASGELQRRNRDQRVSIEGIDPQASDETEVVVLHNLLRLLSPGQRKAFVLRELLGFSTSETASLMGSSAGAVRVHIFAARRRLRSMYQEVQL